LFGFYTAKDASTGLCYNVLILAEKFKLHKHGKQLLNSVTGSVKAETEQKIQDERKKASKNGASSESSKSNKLALTF